MMADLERALEAIVDRAVRRAVRDELAARQPTAELVTIAAFARQRSISIGTVRNAIRDGRLEATKIGRAVRVRADAAIGKAARPVPAGPETPVARAARVRIGGGR
jgi:excisionase family DNA binding protein